MSEIGKQGQIEPSFPVPLYVENFSLEIETDGYGATYYIAFDNSESLKDPDIVFGIQSRSVALGKSMKLGGALLVYVPIIRYQELGDRFLALRPDGWNTPYTLISTPMKSAEPTPLYLPSEPQ